MLGMVAEDVEFDWDDHNIRHLKRHNVSPEEFEQVILNEPLDIEYQTETGESRSSPSAGRIAVAF